MKRALPLLMILALGILTACGEPPTPPHDGPTAEPTRTPFPTLTEDPPAMQAAFEAFFAKLKATGAVVQETSQFQHTFIAGSAHIVIVNGAALQVFAYETPEQLQTQVDRIGADGKDITHVDGMVRPANWIDTPHFYRGDRIIVLYIGRDPAIDELLAPIIGPQFAGDVQFWGLPFQITDINSLSSGLATQGLGNGWSSATEPGIFPVGASIITIDEQKNVSEQDIQVYQFDDEQAALAARVTVTQDASLVGNAPMRWTAPPHFFYSGRLIVLYVGSDAQTLNALINLLGDQFAGS